MTFQSSTVSAGDAATAAQYNLLRQDVITNSASVLAGTRDSVTEVAERNLTTAGTQVISHTLGSVPKVVRVKLNVDVSDNLHSSDGYHDVADGTNKCVFSYNVGSTLVVGTKDTLSLVPVGNSTPFGTVTAVTTASISILWTGSAPYTAYIIAHIES